ncbi:electron transporter [Exiguobacterium sp. KRL4]|uniref:DM13 domain-containing protein n=1 Tax=Exiguobacterium sp. KRL4 TaxID=1914536 RepID=UPI0008F8C41B|nr:DM13 domain-containing protein [Exiguobacterium sp. KRL4]OIN66754.1 electron transporter [Exiguobacterium sp. KRL4]
MKTVRNGSKIILAIVVVGVLALSWWLVSPLFLNQAVDEELPPSSSTIEQEDETPASETDKSEPATPADFSGTFVDGEKNYQTSGKIKTVTADDALYLRFEDFQTTNGPDLFVYLVEPGKKTADGIRIGALKGNQGDQNYVLPKEVDLTKHSRVVIWCRTFDADFGTGDLKAASK